MTPVFPVAAVLPPTVAAVAMVAVASVAVLAVSPAAIPLFAVAAILPRRRRAILPRRCGSLAGAALMGRLRALAPALAAILRRTGTFALPVPALVGRTPLPWRAPLAALPPPAVRGRAHTIAALPQSQDFVAASPDPPLARTAKVAELGPHGPRLRRALAAV
ncbi:MAG TPA: hypothetical protein VGJ98_00225, partial [Candidatus Eisenbacteria bacterium]